MKTLIEGKTNDIPSNLKGNTYNGRFETVFHRDFESGTTSQCATESCFVIAQSTAIDAIVIPIPIVDIGILF